jgi:nucleoside-diphosphate-sugar epimerase
MKILVTGGCGLLGYEVVNRLKCLHHDFIVVDNLLYCEDYLYNVLFQYGNVGNPDFFIPFLKKHNFDVIIHLAGVVGDAACEARPQEAYKSNITSVELLRDHFDGRIIFPSSCSVYGANNDLVNESSILNPLSSYAQMKAQAEEILKDKNAIIFRLGTLHGVSGRLRNDLVVNLLTIRALLEGKLSVFGGNQYRPLVQVKDVASTMINQLCRNHTGIFNLIENNYRIIDIAEEIKTNLSGINIFIEIEITAMPFEDKRNYKADGQKADKILGIKPKLLLNTTIAEIVQIVKEGRIKDFSNIKYSNISALQFGDKNE